jgi:hypothetical protein
MIKLISTFTLIGMLIGFILFEMYHLFNNKNETFMTSNFKRFDMDFVYLIIWGLIFTICTYFWIIFITHFWIVILLFAYLLISERFIYNNTYFSTKSFTFVRKNYAIAIIAGSSIIMICFIVFNFFSSQIFLVGGIFEGADWFTSTFVNMVKSPQIGSISALMVIGGFAVVIGKSRKSSAYETIGYFLIISLPIFSIFNTFLNSIDDIQFIATAIYMAFQSEGLTLIVYVVIEIMFYMLLCSIIVAFTSLID